MNKEKIQEVSEMLNIESSEVIESKIKRFFRKMTFPFIQVGFYLFSSLSGLVFGYWENEKPSIYPWGFIPRVFFLGPLLILGTNTGNAVLSIKTNNRYGLNKERKIGVVLLNIVFSFISFFIFYGLIENISDKLNSPCFSVEYYYGVYSKNNSEV